MGELATDQFLFDTDMDILQDMCKHESILRPWQFKMLGKFGKVFQDTVLESHQEACEYLKYRKRLTVSKERVNMLKNLTAKDDAPELDGSESSEDEDEDEEAAKH